MKRILIAGESWVIHSIHIKGFDTFTTSVYEEGVKWLREAFEKAGYEVIFMPNHEAAEKFPWTMEEINKYDVVFLSDIGSNTLLLSTATFSRGEKTANRCDLIKEYVFNGGAFCMIGGYMSFSGIDGKARYGGTVIGEILPVKILDKDDRVELPQGTIPEILVPNHPIFKGIPSKWPFFLGYNKTVQREEGEIIATINGDPFIAVRKYGKGRTAVFTSDCAPHWGSPEFLKWEYYDKFWVNLVEWLTLKE